MQLFVRGLDGHTRALALTEEPHVAPSFTAVQAAVQAATGLPPSAQVLTAGGRCLDTVGCSRLAAGDTIHVTSRLLGGKPCKVRVIAAPAAASASTSASTTTPSEVTIDLDQDTPMEQVKVALWRATGIPIPQQHVLLGAIGDLVVIDKRSHLGVAYCGTADSLYFATLPATRAPGPDTAAAGGAK